MLAKLRRPLLTPIPAGNPTPLPPALGEGTLQPAAPYGKEKMPNIGDPHAKNGSLVNDPLEGWSG